MVVMDAIALWQTGLTPGSAKSVDIAYKIVRRQAIQTVTKKSLPIGTMTHFSRRKVASLRDKDGMRFWDYV